MENIKRLEEALKHHLEDEYSQFIELSSIKKIKDSIYEVNWMASVINFYSYSPIHLYGKRIDLKDIIRDNKIKSLLNQEQIELSIDIDEIRNSKGLLCGHDRLNQLRRTT